MIIMKDNIIYYDPIKGFITFNDLITDLKVILQDYKTLENILIGILQNLQFDDETIASLFTCDIANSLNNLINSLQNSL